MEIKNTKEFVEIQNEINNLVKSGKVTHDELRKAGLETISYYDKLYRGMTLKHFRKSSNYVKTSAFLYLNYLKDNQNWMVGDAEASKLLQPLMIIGALHSTKIFEVTPTITKLLMNTKNQIELRRLPFPTIFIDANIRIQDAYLYSLNRDGTLFKADVTYYGLFVADTFDDLKVWGIAETKEGHISIARFSLKSTFGNDNFRREQKIIFNFIMNFLDFVNEPNIEWVETSRLQNWSKKSAKKGKGFRTINYIIKLKGYLKKYIEQIETGRHFTYSYKFWVRGHWRKFHSTYYKNMLGKKIWILPYVKGAGILIPKRYVLTRKGDR